MQIPSISSKVLCEDPGRILTFLCSYGGCIVRGALRPEVSSHAYRVAGNFIRDPVIASVYPYDARSRLGYTPNGVEGMKGAGPSASRHFFDYRPPLRGIKEEQQLLVLYMEIMCWGYMVFSAIDSLIQAPLVQITEQGPHLLRCIEYLNEAEDADHILFPPHLDFGLITIFVGGGARGLEVCSEGVWESVEMNEGDICIIAGTLLKQYKSDIHPLRHRVTAASVGRISLLFFFEPAGSTVLPSGENADAFLSRMLSAIRY